MVGRHARCAVVDHSRGFPTDLPMVGPVNFRGDDLYGRGFPTDLPMVGH